MLRVLSCLVFVVLSFNCYAQAIYDGCLDDEGRPVASIEDDAIEDIAMASHDEQGEPIIVYNPDVLRMTSYATRVFFYAHECAHHKLGHGDFQPVSKAVEQEADCWAINTLVNGNVFDDNDLKIVKRDISRFGKSDWAHVPGPMRAINLETCLTRLARAPVYDIYQACMDAVEDSCMYRCRKRWGYGVVECHTSICGAPQQKAFNHQRCW